MDTTAAKTSSYEEPIFEINTTEGTIVIMLYKETPLHRDNFRKLHSIFTTAFFSTGSYIIS